MRRTQKNMISAIGAQIITIITGFLVQRYVLLTYGSSYNGLTSSVTQILQYLVLLEAGMTTASIQALYKPITENNSTIISGILSATKRKFIKVGVVFLSLLLVSSFILPFVVSDEISYWAAFLITIASGAGTGLTYMFINKYQALFYADNKTGIVYNLTSAANVLICVVKILFMQIGLSIIFVQAAALLGVLLKITCMYYIFQKRYRTISFNEEPRYDLISKSNNVLIHQIAGFVNSNTDVLLITVFSTLKNVSLYSVYNMVYTHINSLLQSVFAQAPMGYFGQSYARDKNRFKSIYDFFETGYTYIMFVVLTVAMELILAFVGLYTKGVSDINYIDSILAWLFFISQALNLVRIPSIVTINVSGHFKETQKGAMLEAIINMSVSIPMFFLIGIHGLLIGTVVAMCFRSVDITNYVYKNIRQKNIGIFFYKLGLHFVTSTICICILTPIFTKHATSWLTWIISGGVALIITACVFFAMEITLFNKDMRGFIRMGKQLIKR